MKILRNCNQDKRPGDPTAKAKFEARALAYGVFVVAAIACAAGTGECVVESMDKVDSHGISYVVSSRA